MASTVLVVELPPPAPPPGPPPLDPCPKIRLNISEVGKRNAEERRRFFFFLFLASSSSQKRGGAQGQKRESSRRNECLFCGFSKRDDAQKETSARRFNESAANPATCSRQPWWRERAESLGRHRARRDEMLTLEENEKKKTATTTLALASSKEGESRVLSAHSLVCSAIGAAPREGAQSSPLGRERRRCSRGESDANRERDRSSQLNGLLAKEREQWTQASRRRRNEKNQNSFPRLATKRAARSKSSMGRGDRPELTAPPEVFYNDDEARKYTTNSRMIEIQVR